MGVRLGSSAGLIAMLCALAPAAIGGLGDEKDDAVKVRIFTPRILGKINKDDVEEVARALKQLPSVKIVPHSDATPHFLIEFNPKKVELGELAKAIASVEAVGAKEETAAYLMLTVELKKDQQAALLMALENVKGVDVKKSEFPGGLPRIALDNKGGAKFSEVLDAVGSAFPKKK